MDGGMSSTASFCAHTRKHAPRSVCELVDADRVASELEREATRTLWDFTHAMFGYTDEHLREAYRQGIRDAYDVRFYRHNLDDDRLREIVGRVRDTGSFEGEVTVERIWGDGCHGAN